MSKLQAFVILLISISFVACKEENKSFDDNNIKLANQFFERGDSLFDENEYVDALEAYSSSLTLYEEAEDTVDLGECYFQLSSTYHRLGDIDMSIKMAQKCLHIDSITGKVENLSSSYNTLAALYLTAKDIYSAKKFILKAMELELQTEKRESLSARYGLASEIYTSDGDANIGLEYARKAFSLDSAANDTVNMGKRLSQMGDALTALSMFKEAERLYIKADSMLVKKKVTNSLCINYKQLGILYEKLGDKNRAVDFFGKSLEIARNCHLNYLLEANLVHLSDLYGDIDSRKGYDYSLEAIALKDSIYNTTLQQTAEDFSTRYELAVKEDMISEQEHEIKLQKIYLALLGTFVALIVILAALYIYIRNIMKEKLVLNRKYYYLLLRNIKKSKAADENVNQRQEDEDKLEVLDEMMDADRQFIEKVKQVIEDNIDDSTLSSIRISQELCLSQRQLNRKVKAISGVDTSTYIRCLRIKNACHMLSTTDMTMGEIQAACGFDSPSYFSRVFKNIIGLTPTEYRRNPDSVDVYKIFTDDRALKFSNS